MRWGTGQQSRVARMPADGATVTQSMVLSPANQPARRRRRGISRGCVRRRVLALSVCAVHRVCLLGTMGVRAAGTSWCQPGGGRFWSCWVLRAFGVFREEIALFDWSARELSAFSVFHSKLRLIGVRCLDAMRCECPTLSLTVPPCRVTSVSSDRLLARPRSDSSERAAGGGAAGRRHNGPHGP